VSCGKQRAADFGRRNGADDEGTGTDSEGGSREAEVVGSCRDHGRDGPNDAGAGGKRLNEHGHSGLWDYRKRSPNPKRVPMQTVEQVLQLYREKYFDFNVQHFHQKLRDLHGIDLSYTWVKTVLQTAGLVKHRKRRPRRPLPGMMLHIDGSEHRWFGDERCYELIVVLDDATSEIYYAQLVEAESTRRVMAALREVVETRGLFCSWYCSLPAFARQLQVSAAVGAFLVGVAVSGPIAERSRRLFAPLRDLFAAIFFFFGLQIDPATLVSVAPTAITLGLVTAVTKVITGYWTAARAGIDAAGPQARGHGARATWRVFDSDRRLGNCGGTASLSTRGGLLSYFLLYSARFCLGSQNKRPGVSAYASLTRRTRGPLTLRPMHSHCNGRQNRNRPSVKAMCLRKRFQPSVSASRSLGWKPDRF
jgi:hypothetical protein